MPIVKLATRVLLGERLRDMGFGTGLYRKSRLVAVKMPVFSFEKIIDADTSLGPEMKSTGEVLGVSPRYEEALYKAFLGAGLRMKRGGKVLCSVNDHDKAELIALAAEFARLGYPILATPGTAQALRGAGVAAETIEDFGQHLHNHHKDEIALVVNTPTHGRVPARRGFQLRRWSVENGVPCLTSLDTVRALAFCLSTPCKTALTWWIWPRSEAARPGIYLPLLDDGKGLVVKSQHGEERAWIVSSKMPSVRFSTQSALKEEFERMAKYSPQDILRMVEENQVRFIRLQFTDIFGAMKCVNVTASQLQKVLRNECKFDGSSIEGFTRIEESDMCLYPDPGQLPHPALERPGPRRAPDLRRPTPPTARPLPAARATCCAACSPTPRPWALTSTSGRSWSSSSSTRTRPARPPPAASTRAATSTSAPWTRVKRPAARCASCWRRWL